MAHAKWQAAVGKHRGAMALKQLAADDTGRDTTSFGSWHPEENGGWHLQGC